MAPAARVVTSLSLSTPIYWTGTIAIFVFSAQLDLLPSAGAGRLSQLILPVGVLGFHTSGAVARVTHANVRETLGADFVRAARAKGLPNHIVIWRHVLRASLLPVVTMIALQAGFLFSGTVITESLFVRPGIGRVLLDAIIRQDYPVVQGAAIFTALIYVLFNTLADGLYHLLDPRVTA
jgi:ABC-type dipeptide/oligopeptide/nickel transport system permease component